MHSSWSTSNHRAGRGRRLPTRHRRRRPAGRVAQRPEPCRRSKHVRLRSGAGLRLISDELRRAKDARASSRAFLSTPCAIAAASVDQPCCRAALCCVPGDSLRASVMLRSFAAAGPGVLLPSQRDGRRRDRRRHARRRAATLLHRALLRLQQQQPAHVQHRRSVGAVRPAAPPGPVSSQALQQGGAVRPQPPHRYLEMCAPALADALLSAHACCLWHQEDMIVLLWPPQTC